MMEQKGTLPIGVTIVGVTHRDYALRPRLVKDSVEVAEDARAQTNPAYEGLLLTCKQITALGTLAPEAITPDVLMEMHDVDMQAILEAAAQLQKRLITFREESKAVS